MFRLTTGETPLVSVRLKNQDGSNFTVQSADTVTVGLRRRINGRNQLVAGPFSVSEATQGSDWANGVIVVELTGTGHDTLEQRRVEMEVRVLYAAGKWRTFDTGSVEVIKGAL